ncbi:MAG TPA: glycogen debranching N-terminal domain-containing protein [Caulobacteraceae bacterium]|jgi:glycogen debranching enzyme|nr:glycogen debranching N-terminal domain-containing protein [Caulobacteraceae bacterium]
MDDLAVPASLDPDEAVHGGEDIQRLSLKDGDTFLVADAWGDVGGGADGMFIGDTRILSRFRLLIGEKRPSRLSFGLSPDNAAFTVNSANRALPPVGGTATPRGVIHVERKRCLCAGRLYERVRLTNFGLDEVMAPIAFEFDADFRDMFEVRGISRLMRGVMHEAELTGRGAILAYDGLDDVRRTSVIAFSEPPWRLSSRRADFMLPVTPGRRVDLYLEVGVTAEHPPEVTRFERALASARMGVRDFRTSGAQVIASDGAFNAWLEQSRIDVAVLTTQLPTGPYPYAGIPWFSTPFGRDGIICAWQMLWLDPSLAKGVLSYLAARQAEHVSTFDDATPGKIMHETRRGEMAALKEIPFALYYGGVDTTPLFVALAGAYYERTGDLAFIDKLWPHLLAATAWLESSGDSNGDGLIDYARAEASGLSNQGWKDSIDSIFHADGRLATGPVALVEVQGYAFAAWRAMAAMGLALGDPEARGWAARSKAMREAVEARFWLKDLGFYGLAIDGEGEVCRVEASNPGHLLFVGLPEPARAKKVIRRLLSPDFDSGWGLRTLAAGAVRYNPMSYHNGSVWPHDTAIALAGMARYGERAGMNKVMADLCEASRTFDNRMPELLCGFEREPDEPPIAYPVACMPQAWSAGSTFMMLSASLGLSIDARRREVRMVRPYLPKGVERISLEGLDIAGSTVDIEVQRLGERAAVTVGPGSDGSVTVVVEE